MTLTLNNRSQNKESSLTQALRQIQQLNSKILELQQEHRDYVQKQQNLIGAIAERKCFSDAGNRSAADSHTPGRGGVSAGAMRSVLVKQSQASKMTAGQIEKPILTKRGKNQGFLQNSKK